MKKYFTKLNLRLTHCLSIPVREFRLVQMWRSSFYVINARVRGAGGALVWRFKRKSTRRSWYHSSLWEVCHCALIMTYYSREMKIIASDWIALLRKLLIRDNDSHCRLRKMKIISSDWLALLRRLSWLCTCTFSITPGYCTTYNL